MTEPSKDKDPVPRDVVMVCTFGIGFAVYLLGHLILNWLGILDTIGDLR